MHTREEYIDSVPTKYRGIVKRAFTGRSRKAAMRAKCLECMGYDDASKGVEECTSRNCPMWPYRGAGDDTEE
jgi:hypothetical protein